MAKVDCGNTPQAEPLFPFLCQQVNSSNLLSMVAGIGLKWNFTKFLCDKDGIPVKRFEPTVNPLDFENDIVELLLPAPATPPPQVSVASPTVTDASVTPPSVAEASKESS